GRAVGSEVVSELTLESPVVLEEGGATQLQVRVKSEDGAGRREVTLHGRREGSEPWTRHASGQLSSVDATEIEKPLGAWPPPGAEAIALEEMYDRLLEQGLAYGESFQGLTQAWRDGGVVYGEVKLGASLSGEVEGHQLHPALLDAALHVLVLLGVSSDEVLLPFGWSDVRVHATGATELRVRAVLGT